MEYKVLKTDGKAKRAEMKTVHGTIQTPVFMNVGTVAAIKGAVSTDDLREIGCQVELSNTYHLHVRTGDKLIKEMGGIREFMNWDRPVLTDSGGFQVFSLAKLRKIKEEGVSFNSHIDGHKIFMGPEESMQIQSNLGSTIAMAFDECIENPSPRDYVQKSVDRTTRWLVRCKNEMARLNSLPDTVNKEQLLFGINQGGTYDDIRINHAKAIAELNLDGYAIGGLAVGETHEEMYRIIDAVVPHLPADKPVYLMGVGTPANILEAVDRGVDFFDYCYNKRKDKSVEGMTVKEAFDILGSEGRLDVYSRVSSLDSLKRSILANGPAIIATIVRSDSTEFWNGSQNLGGHAVAVVGFDENSIIIKNSWGVSYGNGGFARMRNEDFSKVLECWTILS